MKTWLVEIYLEENLLIEGDAVCKSEAIHSAFNVKVEKVIEMKNVRVFVYIGPRDYDITEIFKNTYKSEYEKFTKRLLEKAYSYLD